MTLGPVWGALRALLYLLVAVAALALVAFAAWAAFNVGDAAPKARPAELALAPARVADERNAAFAVVGLRAQADRDPESTGRAVWRAHQEFARQSFAQRSAGAAAHAQAVDAIIGKELPRPQGGPLACDPGTCETLWLAQPEALAAHRTAHATWGVRCEKLASGPFEYEELLPTGPGADGGAVPVANLSTCALWLRSGALLSLSQGRRDEAVRQITLASRLGRGTWAGARTPQGMLVASRMLRQTWDTAAAAALREPALAQPLRALAAEPLDTREGASRMMVTLAHLLRSAIDELSQSCGTPQGTVLFVLAMDGEIGRVASTLCGWRMGLQVERTKQRLDSLWQRRIAQLAQGWPAVFAGAAVEDETAARRNAWQRLPWRNTIGEFVIGQVAGAGHAAPQTRLADTELHREATALVLALQQGQVAPAQRAAFLKREAGYSDLFKERAAFSADGRTLTVRAWQASPPGSGYNEARDGMRFVWSQ